MALRNRKTLIFAAIEAVYGTAEALVAADAIQTANASIRPMEGSSVSENLDRLSFGGDLELHVGTHVVVEFDVQLKGSGAAGTAPNFGKLLRACGMSETVNAAVDTIYAPASGSTDSLTLYFQLDGQRHALRGARGTFQLRMESQQIPMLHFVFTGLWVDPTAVADITPDFTGWTTQVRPVTFAHTPTLSFDAQTAIFRTFNYDHANDVQHFDNPGEEAVQIVDREPRAQVVMLAPPLGTKNWFNFAKADSTGVLQIVHGQTAGNIVTLDAPRGQLLRPRYGDDRSRATLEGDIKLLPVAGAGDDEVTLTFT